MGIRLELPRATPSVLWIELTSRCPFRCVFCSRELLRGRGQHLDFALYERLIRDLDRPQVVRLNYSGESSHYPHLVEACALAAQAGATVELVSALAALPEHKLEPLVASGLSRLTVSLHTLDERQFGEIYGFSTLAAMRHRIETVAALARRRRPRPLMLDFAFVAMARNLSQLTAVCEYAQALGIGEVSVHPVIRRDPIEETFERELDAEGRLRPEFLRQLDQAIAAARNAVPAVTIGCSTPELGPRLPLSTSPAYHPWPLHAEARIHGCDQDPLETVHILADGRVVSCEVRDQIALGRLTAQTGIREVWNGEAYREFRERYRSASDAHCRRCPYKIAQQPSALPHRIAATGFTAPGLTWGWYPGDGKAIWSRPQASFEVAAPRWGRRPVLRGRLPAASGQSNVLTVTLQDGPSVRLSNDGNELAEFELPLPVVRQRRGKLVYHLDVAVPYRPLAGGDARVLGIALESIG